jgi:hypothetical protein
MREAAAMARHALREEDTPNADPTRTRLNTVVKGKATAEVIAQIKQRTDPLVKRRDAVRVIEFLIGGSNEALNSMPEKAQNNYFNEAIAWIGKRFGGADNIVMAVIHRDETTPHVQLLLTPILDGKLNAKALIGGPAGLRELHDAFDAEIGKKYRLRRGEKGSRAKHTSIRSFYAALKSVGTQDRLPKRVSVPEVPSLGFFASQEEKENAAVMKHKRELALEHNRKVQTEIARLAELALATHGRSRRRLPKELSEATEVIERAAHHWKIERLIAEKLAKFSPEDQLEIKERVRQEIRADRKASSQVMPIPSPQKDPELNISARKTPGQRP